MKPLLLAVVAALTLTVDASAAEPCGDFGAEDLLCSTLKVPLDREGVRPGTLRLPITYEPARPGAKHLLVALAGGPGQGATAFASSFQSVLRPLLDDARLVVIDQRGTGANALRCPELQSASDAENLAPGAIETCARRIGPSRVDYSTADSVADLEALRVRFGAAKLTLMGVSYGTYVAAQYARTYPTRVRALVLDSPVGPDGVEPFLLDSLTPLKRIVDGWCTGTPCAASVRQSWAAIERLVEQLKQGPISASVPDVRGRKVPRTLKSEGDLDRLLGSVDLNPGLQALMPSALAAAADGDPVQLLRLNTIAPGPPIQARDLSVGLNIATICADLALPFSFDDGTAAREAKLAAALDAIAPARYAPFSRAMVLDSSAAIDCVVWPGAPGAARPNTAPLPDVPALILSGSLDQRTPTENAQQLQALMPRSSVVVVPGTGHDTIDTDSSGCVQRALRRFAAGRAVGQPCTKADNRFRVPGRPGRSVGAGADALLSAFIATIQDVTLQSASRLFGGYRTQRGGGLRGGTWSLDDNGLRLRRYEVIDGLRVTTVGSSGTRYSVVAADGRRARLTITRKGLVTGVVNGRRVQRRTPSLEAKPATAAQAAVRYRSRR